MTLNLNNFFESASGTVMTTQAITSHNMLSGLFGGKSKAGVDVTLTTASTHTTVMSCYRVLSESVASMPIHLMKRKKKKGIYHKSKDYEHPLYRILNLQPNKEMTQFNWIEAMMYNLVSRGNAYSQIIRNKRGDVVAFYPLLSDNMEKVRTKSGKLAYIYHSHKVGKVWLDKREVLSVVGMSLDGVNGLSPIAYSANSIGLSMALEEFGSNFFANGANPGAVYEIPTSLSKIAFERLRTSLKEKYESLKNSGKPMLLEEGLTFKSIGISNNDSQFLETRKFQKSEIASIFRIPPHMINDLEKATFTNIEHQYLAFSTDALMPYVHRFEQALNIALFEDDNKHYISFNMDAMLRGDTKSRYEANGKAVRDGWLTRNEVRKQEGLNPIKGLDTPIMQLNMGKGDEKDEQK
ncbi:MAG: phage portal protein [Sulfurovum sp.]